MATRSAEFLEVDEVQKTPSLHRSKSGGYADHLEQQAKWDRRDRERQMKRYHDSRYSSHQRHPSDRLYVPTFDTNHRRVRSYDEIVEKVEEPVRSYTVREQKPNVSYDLSGEPAPSSALAVRRTPTWQRQRKPSIQVQIHQPDLPSSDSAREKPRRSPSASPRSPTAQPQLQFQFAILQDLLFSIETTCEPYFDVEAADPRDLTFSKIADQAKGFSFELQVWSHVVNLKDTAVIEARKRDLFEAASRTLGRLIDCVTKLNEVCKKARPKDLKVEVLPDADDWEDAYESFSDENDDGRSEIDVTEGLGFIIHSHLNSIQLQLQTLKRLARCLQEATPGAREEVVAVETRVKEICKFFGSSESLGRYGIDPKFAGRKALEEARHAIGP